MSAADFAELAERYIAVWNDTDPKRRRRAIDELWAEDGRYVDPMGVAEGRDAIDATIAAVQSQFAGLVFRLAGSVDGHHNQARFTWQLGPADGEPLVVGFDVAVTDGNGQLSQVLGFLDRVPLPAMKPPPAYAIAHLRRAPVHPDVLEYLERIQGTLDPFGGRFVVHGGSVDVREGDWPGDVVMIEFPDLARARSWYDSAAYQAIKPLRTRHLPGELILVEGVSADHDSAEMAADLRTRLG
ncbi:DUF1330 domain-containing protein [Plantactinospora sp. B24E8]|uniref:DUF1330 domain-containing protein n=1 Tax=Plantactinospora sp. B24E8 TaxID=3153567 RepID=UPI00325F5C46